jgi:hypothetical protein
MIGYPNRYPQFKDLPLRKEDPPYSSWGLWGLDDQVGTIVCILPLFPHSGDVMALNDGGIESLVNRGDIEPSHTRGSKKGCRGDHAREAIQLKVRMDPSRL